MKFTFSLLESFRISIATETTIVFLAFHFLHPSPLPSSPILSLFPRRYTLPPCVAHRYLASHTVRGVPLVSLFQRKRQQNASLTGVFSASFSLLARFSSALGCHLILLFTAVVAFTLSPSDSQSHTRTHQAHRRVVRKVGHSAGEERKKC